MSCMSQKIMTFAQSHVQSPRKSPLSPLWQIRWEATTYKKVHHHQESAHKVNMSHLTKNVICMYACVHIYIYILRTPPLLIVTIENTGLNY